jgi:hypothetical protein
VKLRPKYSLRFFLLFATAVTVFLGYSQIRRQKIWRDASEVEALGARVEMPNDLVDYLWQRRPTEGVVLIGSKADNKKSTQAMEKLYKMGISQIGRTESF